MSRSADAIRDDLLANIRTEFTAIGERVVTAEKSPMYALASAIALEVEGPEAEAAAAREEIFPGTASEDGVLNHADFSGLTRVEASRSVQRVRVTGTPSATLPVAAGKQLVDEEGLLYDATAGNVTFDGAGLGYTTVTARDAGAAGNLALGATLTWQGAPAGFGATAVTALAPGDTTHVLVVGADQETIEELRQRAELWRKERAQGGNRAHWVENVSAVEGVGDAFVWPRSFVTGGGFVPDLPGALVTIPLAAAPAASAYVQNADGSLGLGLSPSYTRVPSSDLRTRVRNYIEGTHDRSGVPVPSALQVQLRPAGIASANYLVNTPDTQSQDIVVALSTDPAVAPWPWGIADASVRVVVSATTTALTLDNASGITANSKLAVDLGTAVVRGSYWLATVQGVVGNVVTLTSALPLAPAAGAEVRPDCGLWSGARAASLGVVDNLGPGDAGSDAVSIPSQRYPRPADHAPDKLFPSRIVAALQDLTGVQGVSVLTPALVSVPATTTPLLLILPGKIRFVPA